MSNFFKRIGKKKTKFLVEIYVERVLISLKSEAELSVVFSRGSHKDETKKVKSNSIGINEFNEKLELITTLYLDTKTGKYLTKKGNLQILLHAAKTKLAGNVEIKISDYANQTIKEKNECFSLGSDCPDKNAKIYFKIKVQLFSDAENDVIEEEDEEDGASGEKKKRKTTDDSSIDESHDQGEDKTNRTIDEKHEQGDKISISIAEHIKHANTQPEPISKSKSIETPQFKPVSNTNANEAFNYKETEVQKTDPNLLKRQDKGSFSISNTETKSTEQYKASSEVSNEEYKDELHNTISNQVMENSDKNEDGDEDDDDENFNYVYNPSSQENIEPEEEDDDPLDLLASNKSKKEESKPPSNPKEGFGRAQTFNPNPVSRPLFGGESKSKPAPHATEKKSAFSDLFKNNSKTDSAPNSMKNSVNNSSMKSSVTISSTPMKSSVTSLKASETEERGERKKSPYAEVLLRSATTQISSGNPPANKFQAMKADALKKRALDTVNHMKMSTPTLSHHDSDIPSTSTLALNQNFSVQPEPQRSESSEQNERNEKFERPKVERNSMRSKTIHQIAQIDNDKIRRLETDTNKKESLIHMLREELNSKTIEAQKLARREAELMDQIVTLQKDSNSSKQNVNQEITALRQKLHEKNEENGELSDKILSLESQAEEMKQTIYSKSEEIRNLNNEVKALRDSLGKLETVTVMQDEEIKNAKSSIPRYENELANMANEIDRLKEINKSMQQARDALIKEKEEINASSSDVEKSNSRQKERILFLENECKKMGDHIRAIEQDKANLYTKANDKFRSMDFELKKLASDNEALKENYEKLEKSSQERLESADKKILELKKQLLEADAKKEEALSLQTNLMIELQTLKKNVIEGTASSKSEIKDSDSSNPVKDILETEIARLKEKLKTSQESYEQQIKELKAGMDQMKSENRELKFNYNEIKDHNEVLKQKIQKLEAEPSPQKSQPESSFEVELLTKKYENKLQNQAKIIQEKDEEIKELQLSISQLQQQTARFKTEVDSLNSQKDSGASRAISESQEKIKELEKKYLDNEYNLKKQIEELRIENQLLKEKTTTETSSDSELAKMSLENESLKKQLKDLTIEKNSMRATRQTQEAKELENLRVRVKEAEKNMVKLEEELTIKKARLSEVEDTNRDFNKKYEAQGTKLKKVEDTLTIMESELVKTKQKLGEVMSLLMESGQEDLMDKVYAVIDGEN